MENTKNKFDINFVEKKIPNINSWKSHDEDYNPFDVSDLQTYYPIYKLFHQFKVDNSFSQIDTKLHIINNNIVSDNTNITIDKPTFFKYGPLLDPCHYLIGKYKHETIKLPNYSDNNSKINSIHNASYVDNFCYLLIGKLLNQHSFIHGIDYYGSFLGIQKQYRIDILDDLEYIQTYDFFHENISKLFHTSVFQHSYHNQHNSKKNKPTLAISNEECNIDFETLDNCDSELNENKIELVYENEDFIENSCDDSDNSVVSNSDDEHEDIDEEDTNQDKDEDKETNDEEDEEDDDSSVTEEPLFAYLYDFPIQMICLEKCENTFDYLLQNDLIDEDDARSILFQIIMILITLQKAFNFTHNDLHTNNIMYTEVDYEFVYYQYKNKFYKVPTFGKIFKIIDFGRAIYTFNGNVFCSDSFQEGGDGHGQYNTEPFFDSDKKRIDPNYSFDLCRLGCSIFDFVIDSDMSIDDMDGFQRIIAEWCTDDDGKNILYKKNGDERYPNFKLYKMIARLVHHHTPIRQLIHPFFESYNTDNIPENAVVINIDNIPSYAN